MNFIRATFLVAASLLASQHAFADKAKLTAAEVEAINKKPYLLAGTTARGAAFIVENLAGDKRQVHSLTLHSVLSTRNITTTVNGDQWCTVSEGASDAKCSDIYKIGENLYESWRDGSLHATWSLYQR